MILQANVFQGVLISLMTKARTRKTRSFVAPYLTMAAMIATESKKKGFINTAMTCPAVQGELDHFVSRLLTIPAANT